MIKKGLLDKHGKPNDKTPADYLAGSVAQLSVATPVKVKKEPAGEDFAVPSDGPEPSKRKVKLCFTCHLHIHDAPVFLERLNSSMF